MTVREYSEKELRLIKNLLEAWGMDEKGTEKAKKIYEAADHIAVAIALILET